MPPTLTVKYSSTSDGPLTPLPVNTSTPTQLSPTTSTTLFVRNYNGNPSSPSTHDILSKTPDLFTLNFSIIIDNDIPGHKLHLSNLLPRDLSSRLPYFFPAAWKALQIFDPGLDGDVYAEQPWVSSPVLSAMSRIRLSSAEEPAPGLPVEEDMRLAGLELDPAARRKYFLKAVNREEFVFRRGWRVELAFGNQLVDFPGLAVVVPGLGWRIGVLKYWTGEGVKFLIGGEKASEVRGVVEFNVEEVGEEKKKVPDKAEEEEGFKVEEVEKLEKKMKTEDDDID
jgi:hypothetical protein